jgi:GTP-binding protein Era
MTELDSLFSDDWPEDHRSGYVAVLGRTNVGKSSLINAMLGQKVAIVTAKPQTTRRRQLGIYTDARCQIIFVDTPGLHDPQHDLGKFMVAVAESALRDADVILWVLDVSAPPHALDRQIAETIKAMRRPPPVILALNKVDLIGSNPEAHPHVGELKALIDYEKALLVSALEHQAIDTLIEHIVALLPEGPRYYPADQVSEVNLRYIAAEVVREKVMLATQQEIPHATAVEVTEFTERSEDLSYINATVYVERESQKGIVIGKQGRMIKQIGQEARAELEAMFDTQVYLDLRVRVLKNWRSDEALMRRLGYAIPKH